MTEQDLSDLDASRLRFDGKVALVTGGSSGLGEATVALLRERGATVVVGDLNPNSGEASLDVTNEAEVDALVGHVVAEVVAFLLSRSASFLTGVAVPVDGGATAGSWRRR